MVDSVPDEHQAEVPAVGRQPESVFEQLGGTQPLEHRVAISDPFSQPAARIEAAPDPWPEVRRRKGVRGPPVDLQELGLDPDRQCRRVEENVEVRRCTGEAGGHLLFERDLRMLGLDAEHPSQHRRMLSPWPEHIEDETTGTPQRGDAIQLTTSTLEQHLLDLDIYGSREQSVPAVEETITRRGQTQPLLFGPVALSVENVDERSPGPPWLSPTRQWVHFFGQ